jgi:hypothetical protein
VSKRHQSSRRRHYGRRLHEIHERNDRRGEPDRLEREWSFEDDAMPLDSIAFLDPRSPRQRFGFAD